MIQFSKFHGIGNDFVMIDLVSRDIELGDVAELARKMCDRHTGVGADGLILVERGQKAPFRMTMLNPDGSNGGMCGNGVRCTARLLLENGHQPLAPFTLEVEDRLISVEPIHPDWIRVNMGRAELTCGTIGMHGEPSDTFVDQPLAVDDDRFHATAVSMGNPHIVIFCEEVSAIDLLRLGPKLEHHPLFPFRTNVHFAQAVDRGRILQRTWERGAGVTMACGSGACSVAVAGFLTGRTDREVSISLPGGELRISHGTEGDVIMEGAAERVFEGDFPLSPQAALLKKVCR